ncbi:PREDICTED: centromere protein M [Thamnophis sirtalis]|uniref:Centromere protein M n=1 Tax=Thamnophis sirtalis TaxID=35019 RepID=A0A6I9WX49_9SAUR|nr:PREDICTED: centromere protein M [Thamnophis sirtalis]
MSTLSAFGKLPTLHSATILLVGTNDVFQQQLAETILKEKQDLKINIHLTASLPLPVERNHIRPRIDLIVFMINVQSKYSFEDIEASLTHVDANFFLGKVCLLVTGDTVVVKNCFCPTQYQGEIFLWLFQKRCEKVRTVTAQRLLRMLQICAGHVSGMSSLSFSSLMKCSIEDSSYLA